MTITTSTTTSTPEAPAVPGEFNGVPVEKLRGTIAKLTDNPDLADFQFTARNEWIEGTGSTSTIHEWYGVGAEHFHVGEFSASADHPTLGHGHGPTPQEYVLHALAACHAAGVATTAANRGITLSRIDTVARGRIDVRGVLGIDPDVRNGFSSVRVAYDIDADTDDATVEAIVAQSQKRSAVFDIFTNPTAVTVEVV